MVLLAISKRTILFVKQVELVQAMVPSSLTMTGSLASINGQGSWTELIASRWTITRTSVSLTSQRYQWRSRQQDPAMLGVQP